MHLTTVLLARYFLSSILQVQILQALCDASQQGPRFGKPLNQCDIYGSVEAGNRLRYNFVKKKKYYNLQQECTSKF